jgi:hypothetical protein
VIAEAIDTVITLGWALLAWLTVFATVGTIILLGAATTGAWAWRTAWRAIGGAWRRATGANTGPDALGAVAPLPEPADGHTEPRHPAWAHTDKDAA